MLYYTVSTAKGSKMSTAMMSAALLLKFPRKYHIPVEQHINGAIQNHFSMESKVNKKKCAMQGDLPLTRNECNVHTSVVAPAVENVTPRVRCMEVTAELIEHLRQALGKTRISCTRADIHS